MSKRKGHQRGANIAVRRRNRSSSRASTAKVEAPHRKESKPGSKQALVLAMLGTPAGASIAAITEATGWQPHSVRGFLAGVVRRKLQLDPTSTVLDGVRIYRISGADHARSEPARPRQRKT